MKIKSNEINFKHLYKVTKICIDVVTFKKYEIDRTQSLKIDDDRETVTLDREVGEEIYNVKPEVISELAGKTGLIIKSFEVIITGKKKKKVLVNKINYLEGVI